VGKWTALASKLRPLPPDPKLQQRVDTIKDTIDPALDAADLAWKVYEAREVRDAAKQAHSAAHDVVTAYEQLMMNKFLENKTPAMTLDNGGSVSVSIQPYARVHDPAAFRQWCHENGYSDSLNMHAKTVNAIAKQRLDANESDTAGMAGTEIYQRSHVIVKKGH
jgi:hypothetical protein